MRAKLFFHPLPLSRGERGAFVLAALLSLSFGCRRSKPNAVAPPPAASPGDRLAPGEAAPGQESVHGLMLPRGGKVERTFGKSSYAYVPLSPESVANYIRTQTDDTEAVVGPTGTVFPKLHVRGAPTDHWLRVEISAADRNDATNLVIDRVDEKPKPPPGKTNAELMKEVGLTPDGKILDPKHIE